MQYCNNNMKWFCKCKMQCDLCWISLLVWVSKDPLRKKQINRSEVQRNKFFGVLSISNRIYPIYMPLCRPPMPYKLAYIVPLWSAEETIMRLYRSIFLLQTFNENLIKFGGCWYKNQIALDLCWYYKCRSLI
jgi:hypothetical protein